MWACTLCPMCCKHKVRLCSFIFSVNVVCFTQGSPRIRASGTCLRAASVVPEHGEVVCFVHAHLPSCCSWHCQQVLWVIEVQQKGFHLGMHGHHCFSCHLPCKHVSTVAIHVGSAEQKGRPDFHFCFIEARGEKNTESLYDEKPIMEVMQRLNNFAQRTTGEIMSSNYPRWRTDSEEVIITANEGWNWAND